MRFLTPWFLLGALAIAGPIVFHLIRRAARERTLFSSLMFLSPTPPRAVRRRKIEHMVLLLLRCACLLLLAAAFARPFFARDISPPAAAEPARRTILLLDTSASMRREGLWNKARATADRYLEKARPADQVAVFAFDMQPRPLAGFAEWSSWPPAQRAALARQRLAAVSPGWMGTQLGLALTAVAGQFREDSSRRREIVLITDLQQGARLDGLQGYHWPPGIRVLVERVAAKPQSDAGLEILEPPGVLAGLDNEVRVRAANDRDSRREKFQLRWRDGKGGAEIYLTPGQTRVFTAPKPPAGTPTGALELSGGDAAYGSLSYYAAPETERETICCLGSAPADNPAGLLYYLARVFPATPRREIRFDDRLAGPSAFAIIATNLAPEQITALRAWLQGGKSALLVLADARSGPTLAGLLGLPEARITEATGDFALLGGIDFQHPLFAPFDDPRFSDFSRIHFWKHRRWENPPADARVLARFDDGSPALAQIPAGQGRLLVLASGWNPADSQLAVSSKFPPLMETMLDWAGGGAPARRQFRTGEAIPSPAASGGPVAWAKPGAPRAERTPTTLAAGAPFLETDTPGIYTASWDGRKRFFAVNVPLEESRTAPLALDELGRLGVPLAADSEPTAAAARIRREKLQAAELESRQKFWRWLIVGALAVTFAEVVLSGCLARRVTTVEATL
jgi:hypothetical protein